MANLKLVQQKYNNYLVVNNDSTMICKLIYKHGGYEINHYFAFLGIKEGHLLGIFPKTEDALPVVQKILDSVIKKLS